MIRHLPKKILLIIAFSLLLVLGGWWGYRSLHRERFAVRTLPARVGEIQQMVKLSTLEIMTDEIFKDTVQIKGVVSRVRAHVYIGFDIENLPMTERGDTLFVQLPREIIEVREATENGYQVLDVWNVQMPDEPVPTPLSTAEENILKRRLRRRITAQAYERGYVRRARENALRSLSALFAGFREHVVIIDRYPDGWREEHRPPAPVPEPSPVRLPSGM